MGHRGLLIASRGSGAESGMPTNMDEAGRGHSANRVSEILGYTAMPSSFPLKSKHVLSANRCFYCVMLSSDGADGASHAKNKLYPRKACSADT